MTIVILDRFPGPLPPYREWLRDSAEDIVVLTGRSSGQIAGNGTGGAVEVRGFPDYDTTVEVERSVIELAERVEVSALIAAAGADLIRAGALRDHLGLPGQGRDTAIAFSDPVVTRRLLSDAGVPTVECGPLLRPGDTYRFVHQWGHPVRIRQRRAAGWPVVAVLRDEAEVRAFTADTFTHNLQSVPSLMVEPHIEGEHHRIRHDVPRGPAVTTSPANRVAAVALSALPASSGYPYHVEAIHTSTGEWLVDSVSCAALDADDHRETVRAQAGLSTTIREVA